MKRMFRTVISIFLTVCLIMALTIGCGTQSSQEKAKENSTSQADKSAAPTETKAAAEAPKVEAKKEKTIGLVIGNLFMTWMQYASEGAKKAAADAGVKLVVYDAENKVDKQTSLIENLIAQKVDGIITNAIEVKALVPALEAADKAGIPLVTFDRRCEGAPYFAHVGSDDVLGGKLIADYIAKKLNGKGRVIELIGALGASPTIDRGKGFHDEIAKYPDIKVVFSQTGKFEREAGMRVMEDAINAVGAKNFDAVFSHNDDMMMGALQAMKDAKIDYKKLVTISYDGIPDELKSIQDGEVQATLQYPVGQAAKAMSILVSYLKDGKKPEKKDDKIDPWIITKDNINSGDFFPELQKMKK